MNYLFNPIYFFVAMLLFTSIPLKGQDFSFYIYFEDALGNKDSLILGYDSNGSDTIEPALGEQNIISQTLDTGLDVRITDEWYQRNYNSSVGTFHTKKQIIKESCGQWFSINSIDIHSKNWPVTAHWDSTLFEVSCRNGSVYTSINPGGWWDTSSPSNLYRQVLRQTGSATFESNTGTWYNPNYAYINNQNDTIPVFWQTFSDSSLLNLGLETIKPNLNYKIYPNPTSGFLYIELESAANQIKKIHIFDLLGKQQKTLQSKHSINVQGLTKGVYFIKIHLLNRQIISSTFIKE